MKSSDRPTDKNNWETPAWVVDMLNAYKRITLDPCSTEANPTFANTYFTPEHDGLTQPWNLKMSDFVFMNPPFGRGLMGEWTLKYLEEMRKADFTPEGVCLFKLDTTLATNDLYYAADMIIIPSSRLNYEVGGVVQKGANFPSVMTYRGHRAGAFRKHIEEWCDWHCFHAWRYTTDD